MSAHRFLLTLCLCVLLAPRHAAAVSVGVIDIAHPCDEVIVVPAVIVEQATAGGAGAGAIDVGLRRSRQAMIAGELDLLIGFNPVPSESLLVIDAPTPAVILNDSLTILVLRTVGPPPHMPALRVTTGAGLRLVRMQADGSRTNLGRNIVINVQEYIADDLREPIAVERLAIAGPAGASDQQELFSISTTDPCCNNPDPCCASTDPCCGNPDPCCGDPDPCCGNPDPCCTSSDPCCGVECDDGNDCTRDYCDGGVCVYEPVCLPDSDPCTDDYCIDGDCHNEPLNCDDGNDCTTDFCDNGVCVNEWSCEEPEDKCKVRACIDGRCEIVPKDCDDGNECTTDSCVDGKCEHEWPCDPPDDPCKERYCVDGNCEYGPKNCDDGNECTTDFCDDGKCIHEWRCPPNEDPCIDRYCVEGECEYGPKDCDDDDPCTEDWCENGECKHQNRCDDGNDCTEDLCREEGCVYRWKCDDDVNCTIDRCIDRQCTYEWKDCDDNDACTVDYCHEPTGNCVHEETECDDGDCCTRDSCDSETGWCEYEPVTGGISISVAGLIGVNDDDDGDPEGEDHANDVIDGESDLSEDVHSLTISASGWQSDCPNHYVVLCISGDGGVRIFNKHALDAAPMYFWPCTQLPTEEGPSWELAIEGTYPGHVTLTAYHYCGGYFLGQDEVEITILQAAIDVARNFGTVPQSVEFSEGAPAKTVVPPLDNDPAAWRLLLPTVNVQPADVRDQYPIVMNKTAIAGNAGQFRVYRNDQLYMDVGQATRTIPPADLDNAEWHVEAVEAGAVDIELAFGGIHKDVVRIYGMLEPPGNGTNRIVSGGAVFDVGRFTAHPTIAAGLAAAAADDNVIIGRGTYNERGLTVPEGVRIAGLGGSIDPTKQYLLNPINMPVVNGGGADAIFYLQGHASGSTRITGLKITAGNSAQGGGFHIVDCTNHSAIRYNHITLNRQGGTSAYGGGAYVEHCSNLLFQHNIFERNSAVNGGGGIYLENVTDVRVRENWFKFNDALYGGGIAVRGTTFTLSGSATIHRNLMESNTTVIAGGAIAVCGDFDDAYALVAAGWTGPSGAAGGHSTVVTQNTIRGNTGGGGGQTEGRGGGIYNGAFSSTMTLNENQITGNTANGDGGGVCGFNMSRINGNNNTISENNAQDSSGGINHGTVSSGYWTQNLITSNVAKNHGGGIHTSVGCLVELTSNRIDKNTAQNGAGGGVSSRNCAIVSRGNNIIENNSCKTDGGGISQLTMFDGAPPPRPPRLSLTRGDVIRNNRASGRGGAVSCVHIDFLAPDVVIEEGAQFVNNSAAVSVNGFSTDGLYLRNQKSVIIRNASITGHTRGAGLTVEAMVEPVFYRMEGCLVNNNRAGVNMLGSQFNLYANIISATSCGVKLSQVGASLIEENDITGSVGATRGVLIDTSNYGGALQLTGNNFLSFTGAAQYAVYVSVPHIDGWGNWSFVDAEDNWWGNVNGPHDPNCLDGDCNNNPPGGKVNDAIDYRSWSPAPN